MIKYDLSILIPSRNEMFLQRTIEDILANIEGNTEIIVVLDGYKPEPVLKADPRITLIYHTEAIGQRAGTNEAEADIGAAAGDNPLAALLTLMGHFT